MKMICQRRQMARKADVEGIVDAVESAEKLTSAEFVVALEPRSGSYRDIDLFFAVSLNFIAMLLAFFGPVVFFPDWVPLNLILLFALAWLFSAHTPFIRRLFCSSERMERQVRELAQLQFLNQGVTQTRGRTGVMVLVSQLEKRVVVVADSGVMRAVDDEKWKGLMREIQNGFDGGDLSATAVQAVGKMGKFMAEPLPVAQDDVDELSNVPSLH
jgi:putative membrane protein